MEAMDFLSAGVTVKRISETVFNIELERGPNSQYNPQNFQEDEKTEGKYWSNKAMNKFNYLADC